MLAAMTVGISGSLGMRTLLVTAMIFTLPFCKSKPANIHMFAPQRDRSRAAEQCRDTALSTFRSVHV